MDKSVYIRIDTGDAVEVILHKLRDLCIPVHQGAVLVRERKLMPMGHSVRLVGTDESCTPCGTHLPEPPP
jgi:hypothetical protein